MLSIIVRIHRALHRAKSGLVCTSVESEPSLGASRDEATIKEVRLGVRGTRERALRSIKQPLERYSAALLSRSFARVKPVQRQKAHRRQSLPHCLVQRLRNRPTIRSYDDFLAGRNQARLTGERTT